MNQSAKLFNCISSDIQNSKPLNDFANYLKIKPTHLAIIGAVVFSFLAITGILSEIIISLFGFLYPAYMTCKALETEEEDKKQREKWLSYWIVFSTLLFIDTFFGWLLEFIPLYFVMKICLTLWLFYPKSNGAQIIYQKFISPFLKKHEEKIDDALSKVDKIKEDIFTLPRAKSLAF